MNILLAVDGSRHTKRMLAYLAAHDELFTAGQRYRVIAAVPQVPPIVVAQVGKEAAKAYYDDEGEKILAPVRKFFEQQGLKVPCQLKVGPPADVILKAAAKDTDLIVMGSHGHTALGNLVMGSVSTKVLAESPVPVLIVR